MTSLFLANPFKHGAFKTTTKVHPLLFYCFLPHLVTDKTCTFWCLKPQELLAGQMEYQFLQGIHEQKSAQGQGMHKSHCFLGALLSLNIFLKCPVAKYNKNLHSAKLIEFILNLILSSIAILFGYSPPPGTKTRLETLLVPPQMRLLCPSVTNKRRPASWHPKISSSGFMVRKGSLTFSSSFFKKGKTILDGLALKRQSFSGLCENSCQRHSTKGGEASGKEGERGRGLVQHPPCCCLSAGPAPGFPTGQNAADQGFLATAAISPTAA